MNTIHVKPAPGLKVRDPADNQPLPPEGKHVVRSVFWDRRLADGDVVLSPAEKTAAKKKGE